MTHTEKQIFETVQLYHEGFGRSPDFIVLGHRQRVDLERVSDQKFPIVGRGEHNGIQLFFVDEFSTIGAGRKV